VSGPAADPDDDGLNNMVEYALGLNPRQPDAASARATADISGGYLELTFLRRHDVGDLSYIPEVSDDLLTWYSGPACLDEVSVTPLDEQRDWVTVRDLTPVSTAQTRFARVRFQP
jgi:hypothetical protein